MSEASITTETGVEVLIEAELVRRLEPMIKEAVVREEEARFRQFKMIVAFIGLIGLGTFGTLANLLIEKAVDSRIEKSTGNISQALDFLKFSTAARMIELDDSFSQDEVDSALAYLRETAHNRDVRFSKKFRTALVPLVTSLAAADKAAPINEIFVTYEREILTSQTLVEALLHHYGQEIVGAPVNQLPKPAIARFEKLERVASSSRVPELALVYRALYETRSGEAEGAIRVVDAIERSVSLNDIDRERFFNEILIRTRTANWMRRTTPQGQAIENATRAFFARFTDAIVKTYGLDERLGEVLITVSEEGIDEESAAMLANMVAGAARRGD